MRELRGKAAEMSADQQAAIHQEIARRVSDDMEWLACTGMVEGTCVEAETNPYMWCDSCLLRAAGAVSSPSPGVWPAWAKEAVLAGESAENLREWVATVLNVYLEPLNRGATDEAIDTLTQVIECRARELAAPTGEASLPEQKASEQ